MVEVSLVVVLVIVVVVEDAEVVVLVKLVVLEVTVVVVLVTDVVEVGIMRSSHVSYARSGTNSMICSIISLRKVAQKSISESMFKGSFCGPNKPVTRVWLV